MGTSAKEDSKLTAEPKTPAEIHLVEPKTKKGRRTIDLPQVTRSALAVHRMRLDEERRLAGSRWKVPMVHCEGRLEPVDDFVFTTRIGTPLEGRNVTKRFQKLLKDAKIPRHRYHDLRHTAATLLAVQGVHPKTIQSRYYVGNQFGFWGCPVVGVEPCLIMLEPPAGIEPATC